MALKNETDSKSRKRLERLEKEAFNQQQKSNSLTQVWEVDKKKLQVRKDLKEEL